MPLSSCAGFTGRLRTERADADLHVLVIRVGCWRWTVSYEYRTAMTDSTRAKQPRSAIITSPARVSGFRSFGGKRFLHSSISLEIGRLRMIRSTPTKAKGTANSTRAVCR